MTQASRFTVLGPTDARAAPGVAAAMLQQRALSNASLNMASLFGWSPEQYLQFDSTPH